MADSINEIQQNAHQINNNNHATENSNGVKEIGIGVEVTDFQYSIINSRNTYTSMAIALVQAVFDIKILLRSNLKGGACKINKNAPRFEALNQDKLAIIEGECTLILN